jgi:glycosyltransferase involved in cell wall biosynthesis
VLVDASVVKPELGGFRTYTASMVNALARRADIELTVAAGSPDALGSPDGVTVIPTRWDTTKPLRRELWRMAELRRLRVRSDAQIIFEPLHEAPLRDPGVPVVMTVHDIGPLIAPALYGRGRYARFLLMLPRALKAADAVVCVSHATLEHLYSFTGVDPRKLCVIEPGVTPLPDIPETEPVPARRDYALYVGTLLGHKNVRTLVRTWERLGIDLRLELAGPLAPRERERFERWRLDSVAGGRIRHHGYVSPSALAGLYRNASMVLLPSLHEGFGLPVVEAMAAGIPAVASDIAAVREVAGGAAYLVARPLDADAWAEAIETVHGDEAMRARLIEAGHRVASHFTWERAATQMAQLFQRLQGETRRSASAREYKSARLDQ